MKAMTELTGVVINRVVEINPAKPEFKEGYRYYVDLAFIGGTVARLKTKLDKFTDPSKTIKAMCDCEMQSVSIRFGKDVQFVMAPLCKTLVSFIEQKL